MQAGSVVSSASPAFQIPICMNLLGIGLRRVDSLEETQRPRGCMTRRGWGRPVLVPATGMKRASVIQRNGSGAGSIGHQRGSGHCVLMQDLVLQASANDVDGRHPPTNVTVSSPGTRAWCWSMAANTRPTWPTRPTSWHARTPPCGLSWCAETSASTAACWHATGSSRAFPQTKPIASIGKPADTPPPLPRATPTRTTAAAADRAITHLEAPQHPTNEHLMFDHPSSGPQ